jgi:hypothetical protein
MKRKRVFMAVAGVILLAFFSCDNDSSTPTPTPADPGTDFSGTWVHSTGYYRHVITGRSGLFQMNPLGNAWTTSETYNIEWDGSKYMTTTKWEIRKDGNTLTVENMSYTK